MSSASPGNTPEASIAMGEAPLDIVHVKHLRVAIRRMKNSLPLSGPGRYNSMVFTSLEKAAMWLGDVLACLGEAYPYKRGMASDIADDTTETFSTHNPDWESMPASEKLDRCREILGSMTKQLALWATGQMPQPEVPATRDHHVWLFKFNLALQSTYVHLREARLDMGMEYGLILKSEQFSTGTGDKKNLQTQQ